ncbi:hypothetical protein U1Q18_017364 [Sarracenia purpurea var. burkii]
MIRQGTAQLRRHHRETTHLLHRRLVGTLLRHRRGPLIPAAIKVTLIITTLHHISTRTTTITRMTRPILPSSEAVWLLYAAVVCCRSVVAAVSELIENWD